MNSSSPLALAVDMTPRELLELEVALLLVKHGKQSVLQAMALLLRLSAQELETELGKLSDVSYALAAKKRSQGKPFSLDSILKGREEKADSLRQLQARFENRTFLPELKDVKRFFERYGKRVPSLKSRSSAQAPLFKLLADLESPTLTKLLAESPTSATFSSLGIISDEILGRQKYDEKS